MAQQNKQGGTLNRRGDTHKVNILTEFPNTETGITMMTEVMIENISAIVEEEDKINALKVLRMP
ncbi:MAG: hypothetical protein ACRBBN_02675 [Methyloligellaceae bacterium]